MAVALDSVELIVVALIADDLVLEFALDIEVSVDETRQRVGSEVIQPDDKRIYMDGYLSFRGSVTSPVTHLLIPNQDAGPFQTLIPRFRSIVESASDLSALVKVGELSSAITRHSRECYETNGKAFPEDKLNTLTAHAVAESYLGRVCFYGHGGEFYLEVARMSGESESACSALSPSQLLGALDAMEMRFRSAIAMRVNCGPTRQTEARV